MKWPTPRCFKN